MLLVFGASWQFSAAAQEHGRTIPRVVPTSSTTAKKLVDGAGKARADRFGGVGASGVELWILKEISLRPITRLYKPYLSAIEESARRLIVEWRDPLAYAFYERLLVSGFAPNRYIDVLPKQRVIYVCVPKNASSRIKMTLSASLGRSVTSESTANNRKLSGLKAPKHVGLTLFRRLANDPQALRFSFVRNPYARLVSCWTNKFRDKPLIPVYPSIDSYLAWRQRNDLSLPAGATCTLPFEEFVNFATTTANERIDGHWNLQADLLDMPGIKLNLLGKVETFDRDFMHVLDHVHANDALRADATKPINFSDHEDWPSYYTNELANRVYKAYERDFDQFQYPRKVLLKVTSPLVV